MRQILREAWYAEDLNVWVMSEESWFTLGITDLAQEFCGKIHSICFECEQGQRFERGSVLAMLEADKTTIDVISPIGGQVKVVNTILNELPNMINEDCYGAGWLYQLADASSEDIQLLKSSEWYKSSLNTFFRKSSK